MRSASKAQQIIALHPSWKDKVTFVYVTDIATPGAFDHVFEEREGFNYIIHTASPVTFNVEDVKKDLIDPGING